MKLWPWVAAGSALGGGSRYLVGELMIGRWLLSFPWDTLFVNISGSLLIGFYAALTSLPGRPLVSLPMRHFVITGFLGGYTTFSIFSLETLALVERSALLAVLNAVLTIGLALLAASMGHLMATRGR
jgi:CrcB protein